ncbi:hypothetical protein [Kordiimonas sp.]|uniref:hypothetical protein n=1 Tax=Kordiimonas sp. TaxID=1970157 RepID=UPI003A8D3DBA
MDKDKKTSVAVNTFIVAILTFILNSIISIVGNKADLDTLDVYQSVITSGGDKNYYINILNHQSNTNDTFVVFSTSQEIELAGTSLPLEIVREQLPNGVAFKISSIPPKQATLIHFTMPLLGTLKIIPKTSTMNIHGEYEVQSKTKELLIQTAIDAFVITLIYTFIYYLFLKSQRKELDHIKERQEQIKNDYEKYQKFSDSQHALMEKNLDKTVEDTKTLRAVYSKMRILQLKRIQNLRGEVDFWRNTIRKIVEKSAPNSLDELVLAELKSKPPKPTELEADEMVVYNLFLQTNRSGVDETAPGGTAADLTKD